MIISLSVFVGIFTSMYYFRRFVFLKLFFMMLFLSRYILKFYFYIKQNHNGKMYKSEHKTLNTYFMDTYNLIENDKTHTVMFISKNKDDLHDHVTDFKDNKEDNLMNKDLIVHCNISDNEDNIIELTDIIRHLCYYFDKNYNLDIFLEYIEYYIQSQQANLNIDFINLNNYRLCVYLNDSEFSERSVFLKDLKNGNKTFKEFLLQT